MDQLPPFLRNERALAGSALGLGALSALLFRGFGAPGSPPVMRTGPEESEALIRSEANEAGIDPRQALLWADLESGLHSSAVGDSDWPFREGGGTWRRFVVDNAKYEGNPFTRYQSIWVSYGLFQLLSPFWLWRVDPMEDPRILLDAELNARLGTSVLMKQLLSRHEGDLYLARLSAGCGAPERCSLEKRRQSAIRLARRAPKWGLSFDEAALLEQAERIGTVAEVTDRADTATRV